MRAVSMQGGDEVPEDRDLVVEVGSRVLESLSRRLQGCETYEEPLEAVTQALETLLAHGCPQSTGLKEHRLPSRARDDCNDLLRLNPCARLGAGRLNVDRIAVVKGVVYPATRGRVCAVENVVTAKVGRGRLDRLGGGAQSIELATRKLVELAQLERVREGTGDAGEGRLDKSGAVLRRQRVKAEQAGAEP